MLCPSYFSDKIKIVSVVHNKLALKKGMLIKMTDNNEINFSKISELSYNTIPSFLSNALRDSKACFLSRGTLNKLAKCIESENASYTKITTGEHFSVRMMNCDDSHDIIFYYRINTEDGHPVDTGAQIIEKFEPDLGAEAYLLQFKIKKDVIYIIVQSIDEEYLFNNSKYLSSISTYTPNTCLVPELREKGLIDKGIDFLAKKLFKTKD